LIATIQQDNILAITLCGCALKSVVVCAIAAQWVSWKRPIADGLISRVLNFQRWRRELLEEQQCEVKNLLWCRPQDSKNGPTGALTCRQPPGVILYNGYSMGGASLYGCAACI
jgi:hypothetical protein